MSGPAQVKAAGTTPAVKTVSIGAAASLTAAIDLNDHRLRAIVLPAGWDAADLTFQGSVNGTDFFNIHHNSDTEYTVEAAASRFIVLAAEAFAAIRHLKIRSGTAGSPVAQGDAVTLTLVVMP